MKVVAIHQPEYLPWLGFFKKMMNVELFVFLDDVQFRKNLREIRPLLDKPLDFEKTLAGRFLPDYPDLQITGAFKSFHAVLIGLWRILDEQGTYPYMMKVLPE